MDKKERINISMKSLLESYGITPIRGVNTYRCLYHKPDKKPSANIMKSTDKFHCFACGVLKDIFEIVQDFEKCSHEEAVKILKNKFGE